MPDEALPPPPPQDSAPAEQAPPPPQDSAPAEQAPPPPQDSAPAEQAPANQAPANDQPPADAPVQLPELELEDHFRGGQPPPDVRMTVAEPKDVETRDS